MKLLRTLTPEVRIIDAKRGLVDYVASDQSLDSYNEIIVASGWKFSRFAKNAPFVDSHDYYSLDKLLGKVVDFRVQGKALIEQVQWAIDVPENALAQLGWKMTTGGYLKAVSVGFVPVRYCSKYRSEPAEMAQVVTELGLDAATAAKVSCIYQEQEQLELSACIIGANPNALAKAHRDGAVKDGDLAACGFDDEGMQFLTDSVDAMDAAASDGVRQMIRGLFEQFAKTLGGGGRKSEVGGRRTEDGGRRSDVGGQKKTLSAATADEGAAAVAARQRNQAEILTELRKLKTKLS